MRAPEPHPLWSHAAFAARLLAGALLLGAGLHKASAPPEEFAAVIQAYYILPPKLLLPAATILPWLEVFLGLALACGYQSRAAAGGSAALFLAFIGALASALLRGVPLENCGCFGGGVHLTPAQAIALDGCMALLSGLACWKGGGRWSLDRWVEAGRPA